MAEGEVQFSELVIISPDSDVYPLEPVPENPCWVVRSTVDGAPVVTIIDSVTGEFLGYGVPPPAITGFSLSGPIDWNPCRFAWTSWYQGAADWFETMGYPTEALEWPTEDQVRAHIQSAQTAVFYELAHGGSTSYASGCLDGDRGESTTAAEIENWIAGYTKMPFTFLGSCGGMCDTGDNTLSFEYRKGSAEDTVTVGYCNMAASFCSSCWGGSIRWQDEFFDYLNEGHTIEAAYNHAMVQVPECFEPEGYGSCMRWAGDSGLTLVPVLERIPFDLENVVWAVNCGGGSYFTSTGIQYEADNGYSAGNTYSTSHDIAGTGDPALYQSERWHWSDFVYSKALANGAYQVVLKFAEIWASNPGQRIFDVRLEGETVIDDLDLFASVGQYAAWDATFDVNVSDGNLDIEFSKGSANNPKISAILVLSKEVATHTIAAWAGPGGSISPSGAVEVVDGEDQTFIIEADPGYIISDVIFDGTSVGPTDNFTFHRVSSDHTIEALFELNAYELSGTVTFNGQPVTWGYVVGKSDQGDNLYAQLDEYGHYTATVTSGTWTIRAQTYDQSAISEPQTVTIPPSLDNLDFECLSKVVWAVNCGGGTYPSSVGVTYEADNGYSAGNTYSTNHDIFGTEDPVLYQSERWYKRNFTYSKALPNGKYRVILKFAEIYFSNPDQRVFDVAVEGSLVVDNLDLAANAGQFVAWDETMDVTVTDGTLDIELIKGSANNPKISAILVLEKDELGHTITAAAGSGGSIFPSGQVHVEYFANQAFDIVPQAGFIIDDVIVDGESYGPTGTYTFWHVSEDHTIHAIFRDLTGPEILMDRDFIYDDDGTQFIIDAFRGTSMPDKASGEWIPDFGDATAGSFQISLGPQQGAIPVSAAIAYDIYVDEPSPVTVSFSYRLSTNRTSGSFEPDEFNEVLFAIDDVLYGNEPNDYVERRYGDVASPQWRRFERVIDLEAGSYQLKFGGYQNKSTAASEIGFMYIDDILVTRPRQ